MGQDVFEKISSPLHPRTAPCARMLRLAATALLLSTVSAEPEYKKGKTDAKWSYDLWAPDTEGSFPTMLFVTGGGGIAPGSGYSSVAKAMAEKGVVVIALSRLAAPQPKTDADLERKALAWLEENVPTLGLKATADFDQLVVSGHSAGNHVFCEFLKSDCGAGRAKAAVMMDPVDGYDPFNIVKNYCTTPGEKLPFDIPALLLRTGLDPVVKVLVACAPDRISNQRFFDVWAGPIWMVNATKYGHVDVGDEGSQSSGGICPTDDEPKDIYHEHVATLVDAFLSLVFRGNTSAEALLNEVSTMKVEAEAQKDYNGHSAPFSPGCTHSGAVTV